MSNKQGSTRNEKSDSERDGRAPEPNPGMRGRCSGLMPDMMKMCGGEAGEAEEPGDKANPVTPPGCCSNTGC